VREGDTLLSLAEAHHTTVQAIMNKNALTDPNRIPVGSGTEAPLTGTVRHVVKAGETLSQLARTYRTTVADIAAANPGLTDLQHLTVGSTLTITLGTAPYQRTHRVRPGESLASIARLYGVSVVALAQANGLSNPNRIPVGQVLVIPK
jgi:LysM repeat protein